MRRIAIALVLLIASASMAAADSALVDKLRGESASLWDVGMMRLRLQAQDAAEVMTREAAGKTTHEVAYHADSGQVIVEFRILNPISSTDGACRRYRRNAISNMTGTSSAGNSAEHARTFLARIFSPTRHFGAAESEGLGAKLADMTDVTVRLGEEASTVCTGGIAEWTGKRG